MKPALLLLLVTSLSAGTLTCDAVCLGKVASVTTITVNALDLKTHAKHAKAVIMKLRHPKKGTKHA